MKDKKPRNGIYMLRKEHKHTLAYMAKHVGVSPSTYHKKESGILEFQLSEAKLLGDYFGLTLDEVYKELTTIIFTEV